MPWLPKKTRQKLTMPEKRNVLLTRHGGFVTTCLVGQSCSSLCTATCQYLPSVCIRHSLAETVDFFSLQFLGLIGSFHPKNPLSEFTKRCIFQFCLFLKKGETTQFSSIAYSTPVCQGPFFKFFLLFFDVRVAYIYYPIII